MTTTAEMQEAEEAAVNVLWMSTRSLERIWGEHRQTGASTYQVANGKFDRFINPLVLKSDFDAMRAQRDEAIRLLRQVSLALESLTPSGSEYISHSKVLDAYYADADACCRFVKEQKADGHKARIEAVDERRRNAALQAQITRLREALGRVERWHGEFPATGRTWPSGGVMSYAALFGSDGERDFMRDIARQALSEPSPSNSGDTP